MGREPGNEASSAGQWQVPISSVSMHMDKKQDAKQTGKPVSCHMHCCTESHAPTLNVVDEQALLQVVGDNVVVIETLCFG